MKYPKMYQPFKEAWIKALRSGKYKQGKGALREGNLFCCLGVACEIAQLPRANFLCSTTYYCSDVVAKKMIRISAEFAPEYSAGNLPRSFAKDIGISSKAEGKLMNMNDNGKSFKEIADWIEENL